MIHKGFKMKLYDGIDVYKRQLQVRFVYWLRLTLKTMTLQKSV